MTTTLTCLKITDILADWIDKGVIAGFCECYFMGNTGLFPWQIKSTMVNDAVLVYARKINNKNVMVDCDLLEYIKKPQI